MYRDVISYKLERKEEVFQNFSTIFATMTQQTPQKFSEQAVSSSGL
jgi:hypothetical protein